METIAYGLLVVALVLALLGMFVPEAWQPRISNAAILCVVFYLALQIGAK